LKWDYDAHFLDVQIKKPCHLFDAGLAGRLRQMVALLGLSLSDDRWLDYFPASHARTH
jgi:hypothetical protein